MSDSSSRLSKAVLALVVSGASAATIMSQFLDEREGDRLRAYMDGARVWTICRGVTRVDGKAVHAGQTATPEECARLNDSEAGKALDELRGLVKVPLSEPALAGIASFCTYNIGGGKCRGSTFLHLLNAGQRQAACDQIPRWVFDGGKDCRVRANDCYGQVERRAQERELCLIEDEGLAL